jgi:hypothetical protein
MSSKGIGIRMGAISTPLKQQLQEQGFSLPDKSLQVFQDQADRISYLNIGGILTDDETRKARERLFKKIKAATGGKTNG